MHRRIKGGKGIHHSSGQTAARITISQTGTSATGASSLLTCRRHRGEPMERTHVPSGRAGGSDGRGRQPACTSTGSLMHGAQREFASLPSSAEHCTGVSAEEGRGSPCEVAEATRTAPRPVQTFSAKGGRINAKCHHHAQNCSPLTLLFRAG